MPAGRSLLDGSSKISNSQPLLTPIAAIVDAGIRFVATALVGNYSRQLFLWLASPSKLDYAGPVVSGAPRLARHR